MEKEIIQGIIKKYKTGELEDGTDEKYAGGFWDLAGELAEIENIENRQTDIYHALKVVFHDKQ